MVSTDQNTGAPSATASLRAHVCSGDEPQLPQSRCALETGIYVSVLDNTKICL
jgi:hypothetical protein